MSGTNDSAATLAACLIAAFVVISGALGILGVVCGTLQCVRHCRQIWKFHKQREE